MLSRFGILSSRREVLKRLVFGPLVDAQTPEELRQNLIDMTLAQEPS